MIFKRHTNQLVGQNITLPDHFTDIDVLDRMVIVAKLEVAACRLEVGRLQGRSEACRIADGCRIKCGNQQVGGVKTLA